MFQSVHFSFLSVNACSFTQQDLKSIFFLKWIDIQSKTRKERQGEKTEKKPEGGLPPLNLKAWKDKVYIK